ncbi:hypothetical protein DFQ26_001393, partial [Actinomortierella ambigua]
MDDRSEEGKGEDERVEEEEEDDDDEEDERAGASFRREPRIQLMERGWRNAAEQKPDSEHEEQEQDRRSSSSDSRSKTKSLIPTKRRLRSNKHAQSSEDEATDQQGSRGSSRTSSGWMAQQQKMQDRIETAVSISTLLDECIARSNCFIDEGKCDDAYSLVVATFGEIEDLEGNTGWSESDDSSKEDEDMDLDEREGSRTLHKNYRSSRNRLQELYGEFDKLKR